MDISMPDIVPMLAIAIISILVTYYFPSSFAIFVIVILLAGTLWIKNQASQANGD